MATDDYDNQSSVDTIIEDAFRKRYGVMIDDNFDNIQIACDYLATLPKNSILVSAWHRPKDLRVQSAAWENGLKVEDLMQQSEWTIKFSEWASSPTDLPVIRKFLMLAGMDVLIVWYHKKPKDTESIIKRAKLFGLTVIENPTLPTQPTLFDEEV